MNATVFTIEQVELIRALRKTGIPLDKLIYAYKELERLERENCQQQHSQIKSSNNNQLNSSFTTIAASFNNNNLSHGNNGSLSISHLNQGNNSNNNSINSGQQLDPLSALNSDNLNYEQNLSNQAGNNSNLFGMGLQPSTSKLNDSSSDLHNNMMHKYAFQPIMLPNSLTDEQNELMEFKKKGENAMLMEIRTFVAKYNIRQSMLSEMIGISQGYISRFFRGEGQDISERAKNLIYCWYLNFRRNPMKILQSCPMTVGDRKMVSESGDLLPIRRDRFIFRKQHLQVLESFFADNQYPDTHTKEQIAEECNQAAERMSTRPLSDKDKVTTSIVSNWFNNRRKDAKMTRQSQDALNQQQNSDSNPSPLAASNQNNNNNSSINSSTTNNGSQAQSESNGGGNTNQSQSREQSNSQGSYYYRDTQPLKLETYPDLPLCYQQMEDEESEPEVE